jgi:hypothetical protein
MRPNLQPKIYKSPVVALQLYHVYATTRYNFVRLKVTHTISPLEELVGGDLPPSSSQRLTGMGTGDLSLLRYKPDFVTSLFIINELYCI